MKEFVINQNDSGQRMDKFIEKSVPLLPKSLMYKYLRLKRIKLNGKKCEIGTKLNAGDTVQMYINDEFFVSNPETEFLAAPPDVKIVYEDENILLADKPAGLVVHESSERSPDTLINRILHYLYDRGEFDPDKELSFTPALCNRIDRNTCGIVIAAKNAAALRIMNQKIKDREIKKTYLCAASGTVDPPRGTLFGYLTKDERTNTVTVSDAPVPGAKTAVTEYRTLKSAPGLTLLEIDLKTGRTHQIRAQLAHLGFPLLGDGKYGTRTSYNGKKYKYQALCSYKLKFDFTTDSQELSYLNGREFKAGDAWFLNLFQH